MTTEKDYDQLYDKLGKLRTQVAENLSSKLAVDPQLADLINKQIDDMMGALDAADMAAPPPPDGGLGQLAGVGPEAATLLGETRMPRGIKDYDESVASQRVLAVGDLYYVYQHEKIGVFRVLQKLQELFQQGAVRLSDGPGAFGLYKFDRRDVLRYTKQDRIAAYRRILGYGKGRGAMGARPNTDFHRLLVHFSNQVALFWRDKRISDVVRLRAYDPSFGSIAVVRRAGLDLRNNLKFTSYGHLNVLRVELMQLLDEGYRILDSPDVKELFGAANAWDVVDEVLIRYFDERLVTSPRQRMGVTGRQVLRWLGSDHIMEKTRAEFETLLLEIAEPAEEWITSAQSLNLAQRSETERVMPWVRSSQVGVAAPRREQGAPRNAGPAFSRRGGTNTYRGSGRAPARTNGTPLIPR
ncbi:hypothetical protein ACQPX6_03065 [Actinomycetospora sp. CA-101289]|uniref:hypothetical protein n=1 Tax=Actinomycetospora sp. CA-101289 TaxID=3239893 RepID=UPI003D9880D6